MTTTGIRRGRRALYSGVAFLLLAGLAETVCYAGFWIQSGARFSWSRTQSERATIVQRHGSQAVDDRAIRPEVAHPYLGYVLNHKRSADTQDSDDRWAASTTTRRDTDTVIVAIVGGSVAFHFASQGMPAVIDQLKRSRDFADKRFVVANFALGGYKQPQQLMTLNYLLALGNEIDVVVNIDGFNEVALHEAENGKKGVYPIYPRSWNNRVGEAPDATLRGLTGRMTHLESRIASTARRFSSAPLRFSVTANLVWRLWHESLTGRHHEAMIELRDYRPQGSSYVATGPTLEFGDEPAMYEHLVAIWKRSSLQMDRLCRANGILYYHFLQPNQYVPDSKQFTAQQRAESLRENHPYKHGAEQGYPGLIREGADLATQDVRFFDLTRLFAEESRDIYSDDCCHYNELGNQLIAARVSKAILANR